MSAPENVKGAGLFYVNSKITASDILSPEAFTTWYNDIHIPDIFLAKGIRSAFRYYTVNPGKVERPYLALYPLENVNYLFSDSFKSIPAGHTSLPGSGSSFDLADFDCRNYTKIKTIKGEAKMSDTPNYVVTLCFDVDGHDDSKAIAFSNQDLPAEAVRINLYKLIFARQNKLPEDANYIASLPKFLAILEFDKEEDFITLTSEIREAEMAEFKLIKAFGEKVAFYD